MASVGEHGWPIGNEGKEQIPAWAKRYAISGWTEGRRTGVQVWMVLGVDCCTVAMSCDGLARFRFKFRQAIEQRWRNAERPDVSPIRAWRNHLRVGKPVGGRPVKGWRTFRSFELTTREQPPDRLGLELLGEIGGYRGDWSLPIIDLDVDEANYLLLWLEHAWEQHCGSDAQAQSDQA